MTLFETGLGLFVCVWDYSGTIRVLAVFFGSILLGWAPIEAIQVVFLGFAAMSPKIKSLAKGCKGVKTDIESKVDAYVLSSPAGKAAMNRTMAEIYPEKSPHESDSLLINGCSVC